MADIQLTDTQVDTNGDGTLDTIIPADVTELAYAGEVHTIRLSAAESDFNKYNGYLITSLSMSGLTLDGSDFVANCYDSTIQSFVISVPYIYCN